MSGLLLLSAGIDSPVAGHLLSSQLELVAVHFHSYPVSDKATIEKSKELCKHLGIKTLHLIPFADAQAEVVRSCNNRYYYILTRRLMYRIAQELARSLGARCLITGESLGQVASQTLDNLTVIDAALDIPVHRPLLGQNKQETIKIARDIGTYETSKGPEVCCMLGPKNPITKAKLDAVLREEGRIDTTRLIKETLARSECLKI